MFSCTIRENLLYANPLATNEQISAALQDAGCASIIASLPDGLDTKLAGEAAVHARADLHCRGRHFAFCFICLGVLSECVYRIKIVIVHTLLYIAVVYFVIFTSELKSSREHRAECCGIWSQCWPKAAHSHCPRVLKAEPHTSPRRAHCCAGCEERGISHCRHRQGGPWLNFVTFVT